MKTIVAIGGGEIGRPGYPVETTAIDREIIRLTGKQHPKLLFIPTASSDSELYVETVQKHFGQRLGCLVDVLYLMHSLPISKEIERQIMAADIIYVGGGNTLKMLRRWKKLGVDKLLKRAYVQGVILAGVSAGSVCWFRWGLSDSRKFKNPDADYIRIRGLGLIDAVHCPHFDIEPERKLGLKRVMKRTPGVAIALDNCATIIVQDDSYSVIASKPSAKAYKTYWQRSVYHQETVDSTEVFQSLKSLLTK